MPRWHPLAKGLQKGGSQGTRRPPFPYNTLQQPHFFIVKEYMFDSMFAQRRQIEDQVF